MRWMMQAVQQPNQQRGNAIEDMVARRVSGEPLQYILGIQPFGPLNLLTRPPVLIPRPETEDWTMRLTKYVTPSLMRPIRLLDLCTGSGCIPLLLCRVWPAGSVKAYGVDIAAEAVQLASENTAICGFSESSDDPPSRSPFVRNTFRPILADIRDPAFLQSSGLHPPFHVVTSNPPYIPRREYELLPPSVKEYEDKRALLGDPDSEGEGGDGLTFYRDIARLIAHQNLLAEDGVLAVEVGKGQARDVERILRDQARLTKTTIWQDPWSVERVVVATR
ncbi:peptide chain release factor N(5)-glutamine methyltransferase [Phanerochaete sordida]|uniref:Peptide chain release factor N(5)-glutamine methyltransferase n=1 Tax=Phanerochaete sordida TaxID=48140 RepID=A0A9P3GEA9_9APHY|nr:peptide chain release factor N(5)-glutamine methyltransferase [Phanerochaete sordida]